MYEHYMFMRPPWQEDLSCALDGGSCSAETRQCLLTVSAMNDMGVGRNLARVDERIETSESSAGLARHAPESSHRWYGYRKPERNGPGKSRKHREVVQSFEESEMESTNGQRIQITDLSRPAQ